MTVHQGRPLLLFGGAATALDDADLLERISLPVQCRVGDSDLVDEQSPPVQHLTDGISEEGDSMTLTKEAVANVGDADLGERISPHVQCPSRRC